jgi:hypothetical protein
MELRITEDRNYLIIDSREVNILDFSQFIETSGSILYNSGSTKAVVKYIGSSPTYTFTYPTSGSYSLQEIKDIQDTNPIEWTHGEDDDWPQNPPIE